MGKIFNNMPSMIMGAMKAGEPSKANAYRNLKAKMLEWKTSKEGAKIINTNNGEIPDAQEIVITKKYVTELLGDVELYKTAKPDMSQASQIEADYLSIFLPAEASKEDIENCIKKWWEEQYPNIDVRDYIIEQKQMGTVIKYVKSNFENVDGKLVSEIVRKYIVK